MGASWADRNSKYCCFEVLTSLILCNKQQWMISWSDCNMWQKVDYIRPPAMTNSVIGLRRSSKVLPKAKLKLVPKKVMSLFGGLLPIRSTTAFWILAKLLHLRSMLSKSMRCRWQPPLFNRMGPILHNNAGLQVTQPFQKLNELGYKVLFHLPYSPDRSPTNYHFFKHLDNFLQGKCFHNQ